MPHSLNNTIKGSHKKTWLGRAKSARPLFLALSSKMMKEPSINQWISDITNTDAMTFEDAYWGTRPSAAGAVPELIKLLNVHDDSYTLGKLIELLGECGDKSVIPILENELQNLDEGIRSWARAAIIALERGEKWQQNSKYL